MRHMYLLFIALIILSSCSSAPEDEAGVVETKQRAAEYTDFGNTYFSRGQYDQAKLFFQQALSYNLSIDNESGIVQSHNSLGKVALATGDHTKAESHFSTAFELAAKIKEANLIARSANNLGELKLNEGDPHGALEYFTQALSEESNEVEETERAILYHNAGTAHKQLGDYEESLRFLNLALSINLKLKRYEELAANYYMVASVYSKTQRYDEALSSALLALEYDKLVENSIGIAKDLVALGIINEKSNNLKVSYEYYQRAFLVYEVIGLLPQLSKMLERLIRVAEALGKEEDVIIYKESLSIVSSKMEDSSR
ncbi:MAG: tetratricopeptide repeat protein [Spirochaetales bacterium]|nr:tetratricopeptide repeat protein [Spirochaetales bacterium]